MRGLQRTQLSAQLGDSRLDLQLLVPHVLLHLAELLGGDGFPAACVLVDLGGPAACLLDQVVGSGLRLSTSNPEHLIDLPARFPKLFFSRSRSVGLGGGDRCIDRGLCNGPGFLDGGDLACPSVIGEALGIDLGPTTILLGGGEQFGGFRLCGRMHLPGGGDELLRLVLGVGHDLTGLRPGGLHQGLGIEYELFELGPLIHHQRFRRLRFFESSAGRKAEACSGSTNLAFGAKPVAGPTIDGFSSVASGSSCISPSIQRCPSRSSKSAQTVSLESPSRVW